MLMLNVVAVSGQSIAVVCDASILGNKYEEGKLVLDMTQDFYTDSWECCSKDIRKKLSKASQAFFAGRESVDFAVSLGIISYNNVIKIQGIPYVMVVVVPEGVER